MDVVLQRALHSLVAIVDLRDHAEVRLRVEEVPKPVTHDRVVVRDQHAVTRGMPKMTNSRSGRVALGADGPETAATGPMPNAAQRDRATSSVVGDFRPWGAA